MNSQFNSSKGKKSNAGCIVGGVIAVACLAIGLIVFLVIGGFAVRKGMPMEVVRGPEPEIQITSSNRTDFGGSGRLLIQESELASFLPGDVGDTVSEKHFVAIVRADNITSLGKKVFAEKANGKRVEWMLEVSDIKIPDEKDEFVEGEFSLPYVIRSGNSSSGSALSIRAKFPPEASSQLIRLRVGSWVKVGGNLKFSPNDHRVIFENAELVTEAAEAPEAE